MENAIPKSYIISTNEFYTAVTLQHCMHRLLPNCLLKALVDDIKGIKDNPEILEVDLILTDTSLSDGECIPFYRTLSLSTPMLVFSALDRKALDFTGLNVVGFLLKPISEPEFANALDFIRLKH